MDTAAAGRDHRLLRTAAGSVGAGVAARDPGTGARDAPRHGAARRRASQAAGWHDGAYLRVDASARRANRARVRAAAAVERLDRGIFDAAESGVLQQEMNRVPRTTLRFLCVLCLLCGLCVPASAQSARPLKIG